MWRNLVLATTLLAGPSCLGSLSGEASGNEPKTAVDSGATRRGFGARRTNEPRPNPQPKLSDLAGPWRGKAVDYPEDGSSTDTVGIKLAISKDGQLQGVAFDDFVGGDETRLEDVYMVGNRLEFKVRHRTGVQMRVTLGLDGDKLKGEGIPIRSDDDRCTITLERSKPGDKPGSKVVDGKSGDAKSFDGRWVGVVKDKPGKGGFRHSLIVDVSVDKRDGTTQIITMGGYQQAHDEHIDDAKVQNGKLAFRLIDRHGALATISLWSQPGEKNRLWGEAVSRDDAAPVRNIELKRADDRREYTDSDGYRRMVVDPSLLPDAAGFGRPRLGRPGSRFR